mmetsp:Transcript_96469/g.181440  ORF Transcript_96469/g.181440 Transcript_96469/m.181440 type:complete len:224 (+) Transcript_96469:498-1169(+)
MPHHEEVLRCKNMQILLRGIWTPIESALQDVGHDAAGNRRADARDGAEEHEQQPEPAAAEVKADAADPREEKHACIHDCAHLANVEARKHSALQGQVILGILSHQHAIEQGADNARDLEKLSDRIRQVPSKNYNKNLKFLISVQSYSLQDKAYRATDCTAQQKRARQGLEAFQGPRDDHRLNGIKCRHDVVVVYNAEDDNGNCIVDCSFPKHNNVQQWINLQI